MKVINPILPIKLKEESSDKNKSNEHKGNIVRIFILYFKLFTLEYINSKLFKITERKIGTL